MSPNWSKSGPKGWRGEVVKILGLGFADVQDVGLMPPKRIESREMGFVRDVCGIKSVWSRAALACQFR